VVWSDRSGGDDPDNCAAPDEQQRYTFSSSVDGAPDGALGPLLGGSYHYLRSNMDPCDEFDGYESAFDSGSDSGSGDFEGLSFNSKPRQCPNRGGYVGVADASVEGAFLQAHVYFLRLCSSRALVCLCPFSSLRKMTHSLCFCCFCYDAVWIGGSSVSFLFANF
jgi:hypothetical protein